MAVAAFLVLVGGVVLVRAQGKGPADFAMPKAETSPGQSAKGKAAKAETPKNEDCLACHADKDLERGGKRGGSLFVDAQVLDGSRHAGLDCASCHTTATAPHDEKLPRVDCAGCHADKAEVLKTGVHGSPAAARAGDRATTCANCHGTHDVRDPKTLGTERCAACHQAQVGLYRESIHGKARARGDTEAATCTSCHGPAHTLQVKTDPQAPTYHLNLPRTCATCHGDPEIARRHNIEVGDVYKLYMDSIHGRAITRSGLLVAANCSDCHGAHDIKAKDQPTSRVFRTNVPATCGTCHAGVLREYRQSVHGQAVAAGSTIAPICIDCHSAHEIRRVEAEGWKLEIVRECGTCHKESLRTYRDTFHGKVTALGFTRVARCSDCHGAHDIYPTRDVRSTVNVANRVTTCAKCHPASNENFAKYDPHAEPENVDRSPLLHYTWKFMVWLLVGTFSFFGVHTVLWGVRSLVGRNGGRHAPPPAEGSDQEGQDA
ncbi:MAG: cytochrome c3 family protein [Candidatus Rokubacteria bacterium]|nr:cytochrome c3 family protein [Candidatus Rokubacteria bacterium]